MSNENDVVESRDLNRLENLIDSNQADLKREVESLIDRRFGSLREEVKRLKSPHSALDQIHNGLALLFAQDNRRDLRDILSTITSRLHSNEHTTTSTLELDSSEVGDKDTVETANLGGNELGTEERGNDLDTNVPLTLTANDANLNESMSGNEQVNSDTPNLSSISTTIDTNQSTNETSMQQSNSTINIDQNESPTSEQSNTRKRRRAGKSLATECSLENSLPSAESTSGSMTMSKRARVSSTLNRRESAEQVNTQSGVDSSDEDGQNGGEIDSSGEGEEGVEQSEDEERSLYSETELGEEKKGHYRIETLKLKCIEENCNAEVASRDELHRHLRNDHLISSPYRCLAKGCLERFEQWNGDGLAVHVRDNHSNITTWQCPHCTKTFKSQKRLYMHLHYYHFEGQFKCGYGHCHDDRVTTLRSQLLSHQHSVHPNSTFFTCQFINCAKSFTTKGNLKSHQRIHTGVKPFRCGWTGCDKSFNHKDSLNAHQWKHQKIKPYKCTWNRCGYASTSQSNIIQHIRMKHFRLPKTQTEQRQRGIEDNRDPRKYLLNTTHQSDHNSADSDDSDH